MNRSKLQKDPIAGTPGPVSPLRPRGAARRSAGWLTALAAAPLVLACACGSAAPEGEAEPGVQDADALTAEEAFPGRTGEVRTALIETVEGIETVSYELIDDYMVHEGDIILGRVGGGFTAQSATLKTGTWQGPNLPNKQRITDAVKHWASRTDVQLVPRTNQKDYVVFEDDGKGCYSYIGRRGGRQTVSLAKNCSTGSAIHEIGHAVGLFHEQSRQDRDRYVTVLYNNIQSGKESNFDKYRSTSGRDVGKFDFDSIMIYGTDFFSRNGKPTLVHKDGSKLNAQRSVLSQGDLGGVAKLCGG
jgi:hypothetical protein